MAIISASIEANGWVLRITHTSGPGGFAGYALDPNAAPRVTLTATSVGFAPGGGTVVPAASVRSLVATKPLRLPVVADNAGNRAPKTIDETDLGGGQTRVRLALSQHVYATDTDLRLAVLAGWRAGEAAAAGIAVTNESTLAAAAPIVRWTDVPLQHIRRTTAFDLEVVAFSHHPKGLAPIAGVRFTATDGTNTASGWATALSTSTKAGDALRVYKATIDGATATPRPLGEGLIRCDFKAFPWIGPARASDTGDTAAADVASSNAAPAMTGLASIAHKNAAQTPFVVAYDPGSTFTAAISGTTMTVSNFAGAPLAVGTQIAGAGVLAKTVVTALGTGTGGNGTYSVTSQTVAATAMTGAWIQRLYVYVAPGGTTDPAACTVSADPAAASAGTPASDFAVAKQRIKSLNRVIAARNGQAAESAGCTDGMCCRYKAGSYITPTGGGDVATGVSSNSTWDIVEGDPADPDPRANVLLRTGCVGGGTRASRLIFRNLTIEMTNAEFTTCKYVWADNVELRGQAGMETQTAVVFAYTGWSVRYYTNCRYWKHASGINYTPQHQPHLVRNCQVEYPIAGAVVLNCARLPTAKTGNAAVTGTGATGTGSDILGVTQDVVVAGNDLRYVKGARAWLPALTPNAAAGDTALGTTYAVFNRQVFVNNVTEQYGGSQPVFGTVGETAPAVSTNCIIEGNTCAGDRINFWYDVATSGTVALTDSDSAIALNNRFANNSVDQHSIKTDFYNEIAVKAQRQAAGDPRAHGFRPNAVRSWAASYGVGFVDNIIFKGNTVPDFLHEFDGLNTPNYTVDTPPVAGGVDPKYTLNKSGTDSGGYPNYDPANTGGGDYKPLAGSPNIGHARSANVDRDRLGAARTIPFASGAVEAAVVAVVIQPDGARHATRAAAATLGAGVALAPAPARSATRAGAATLAWSGSLAPAPARAATRAGVATLALAAALQPARARQATAAAPARIVPPAAAAVAAPPERTLVVTADLPVG